LYISQPVNPTPKGRINLAQELQAISALCATKWFISLVAVLAEYTRLGKNVQNLLVLSNGDPIPNDLTNHSWDTWVKFYARNPYVQANFAANLLQVHRKSPMKEENSSLLIHLESINKEDEELSSLGGEDEFNKLQLDRCIEVLQIKRKEMDTGKKSMDLLTLVASKVVQPMDTPLAERLIWLQRSRHPWLSLS